MTPTSLGLGRSGQILAVSCHPPANDYRMATRSRPPVPSPDTASLAPKHPVKVRQAAGGLLFGAALDGEHSAEVRLAQDRDDSLPIDDAVAAGASHGRPGHLAAFRVRVLDGNVLGVDVNQQGLTAFSPS